MAYSKQTWVRGEKVASTKLNHMEDGIAAISANGAIDTEKLANAAVTNDKIDQEAVDSNNIRTGGIITENLADGAVTLAKLADEVKEHFATADDVDELESDFIKSLDGVQTFYGFGNFQHYGLNPDGTFLTSQQYRVSNNDPMTFDRPLTISVKTGFRWGYIPFVDGVAGSWSGWKTADFTIPAGTSFVVQIARVAEVQTEIADVSEFLDVVTFLTKVGDNNKNLEKNLETVNRILADTFIPVLRNGSAGNTGNANAISTDYIYPIDFTKDSIFIEYTGDASLADEYAFAYCKFSGATDGMKSATAFADTGISKAQYNQNGTYRSSSTLANIPTSKLAGYDHIMFFLHRFKDGTLVPLRIASDQYSFRVTWRNNEGIVYNDVDFAETKHDLLYAKHAKGNIGARLTLLHFSDLHKDTDALARIMGDAKNFAYDDAICTGDMVGDTYEQISSWWDASVLTCIGNHDSASYSSSMGYNWTALSMANRAAYYIEPFESEWGITHTSGTSYYYKDYDDAKVRLIVMDAMLYSGTPGIEATAQTAWLENLLADAITNDFHVLIAIHAPHGGATAEDCSFSRYGQTAMPTYTDCNTPQDVIDTVAAKITGGLKFIGYLVGHTHQDNIWDAENDGKQLMYCITCAAVGYAPFWAQSDQHRDDKNDAYNVITIDTANTLVKIIRGGGANMDDHMRTRKAICFNYLIGQMVGEVL